MPVKIKKKGSRYEVSTPSGTKAKGTTKKKAEAQKRLLNMIDREGPAMMMGKGKKRKHLEDL